MERNKNRVTFQIKPSDLANTVITKSNPNKNYIWNMNLIKPIWKKSQISNESSI